MTSGGRAGPSCGHGPSVHSGGKHVATRVLVTDSQAWIPNLAHLCRPVFTTSSGTRVPAACRRQSTGDARTGGRGDPGARRSLSRELRWTEVWRSPPGGGGPVEAPGGHSGLGQAPAGRRSACVPKDPGQEASQAALCGAGEPPLAPRREACRVCAACPWAAPRGHDERPGKAALQRFAGIETDGAGLSPLRPPRPREGGMHAPHCGHARPRQPPPRCPGGPGSGVRHLQGKGRRDEATPDAGGPKAVPSTPSSGH